MQSSKIRKQFKMCKFNILQFNNNVYTVNIIKFNPTSREVNHSFRT